MQNTRINLSTKAQTDTNGVKAPVIISFQTTTSAAGQIYSKVTFARFKYSFPSKKEHCLHYEMYGEFPRSKRKGH